MSKRSLSRRAQVRMFLAREDKSQSWLAAELGVAESQVSRWLNGWSEPSDDEAKRLAAITRLPVELFQPGA